MITDPASNRLSASRMRRQRRHGTRRRCWSIGGMWCRMEIRSSAVIAATRQSDPIAWAPAAIVIAERLIEAYIVADADAAIVTAAGYASGNRRKPCHDQYA